MSFGFSTIYSAYGEAVMSIFITSSTWITVTMAAGRYFAICSPFRARDTIRDTNAKRCITAIVCLSVLCNIPRFWSMSIETVDCEGHQYYFRWYGPLGLETDTVAGKTYFWLYSTLVIFLPLILLVISSVCLVRKLRQTTSMRYDAGTGIAPSSQYISSTRDIQITVTLITIATVHVILVSPAEVLSFLRNAGSGQKAVDHTKAVFNTMQMSNFTLNFLLYAILNTSFRRTLLDLLRCRLVRWRLVKRDSGGGEPQCHRLLTLQSYVNVGEMVNNNTTLPVDDVINTCL
jgi:heme/copper-type cytochrome/quinol oxidase subunit 2